MAGKKKQEIQLQREIETQEEWEECMAKEGLWVVDVYQEWCGPCQALVTNFRRLKNELGDTLLNYAIAKADTIDALDKYRGRCEPTFLFFAGGILVSFIHGANAPKIQRTITEQLAQEHKVMEGAGERKEVKDIIVTRLEEKEAERQEAEEAAREAEDGSPRPEVETPEDLKEPKGVTIAIIKPDAVAEGKTEEIIQEMKDHNLEIVAQEEREMTDEEARELYTELQDEEYFEDLIKFITSGPSCVLAVTSGTTGETVVKDWREMIGPTQVEAAKEEAPESLRAKYGGSGFMNAVHGSSSSESAARELAFFFPNLAVPTYKKKKENIQRTLALIRPEAFAERKDEILAKISEAGFKIAMSKQVQLTKEQASDFYKEHEGQAYFDQLIDHMSSGPLLALGLAGDEAITAWRDMLGPQNVDDAVETAPDSSQPSLRATFKGPSGINQIHGSDSEETAKKELEFFFPMEQTVAVIKPSAMETKDAIVEKIHEAGFRIAAHKETTITKDIAEILYPHQEEKEYYDELVQSMTSGPTMFMVLTREDAVDGWRQAIGDTNPEEAKAHNPDSLRAQFGQDILNNAVHGSSNRERAKEEMKAVFGDLEFNEDGTLKGQEPELDEATEALRVEQSSPVADVAPEYRVDQEEALRTTDDTAGETTQDDTTADMTTETQAEDSTQPEITVIEPSNLQTDATTAETESSPQGEGERDTQQMETSQEGEGAGAGDTTQDQTTTEDDTTQGDTTAQEQSTAADEEGTVNQTADETVNETVDETANDTTVDETADTTAEETVEITAAETTSDDANERPPSAQAESKPAPGTPTDEPQEQTESAAAADHKEEVEKKEDEEEKKEVAEEKKEDSGEKEDDTKEQADAADEKTLTEESSAATKTDETAATADGDNKPEAAQADVGGEQSAAA